MTAPKTAIPFQSKWRCSVGFRVTASTLCQPWTSFWWTRTLDPSPLCLPFRLATFVRVIKLYLLSLSGNEDTRSRQYSGVWPVSGSWGGSMGGNKRGCRINVERLESLHGDALLLSHPSVRRNRDAYSHLVRAPLLWFHAVRGCDLRTPRTTNGIKSGYAKANTKL